MTPDAQWFYTDTQQQQLGPVSLAQLQQLTASGQVQATQLVWTEGMANWLPASQIPNLFQQAATPAAGATGAGAVTSPYAAPGTQVAPQGGGAGAYPAPFVKKTSLMIYLGAFILSFIVIGITFGPLAVSSPSPPDYSEEMSRIAQAETQEEMVAAREALDKKEAEFSDEIKGTSGLFVGFALLGVLVALALAIFAIVYGYIIIYRAWHVLQPGAPRTTPGKAVGFMFIPIFNIYWMFQVYVGWVTDWNRIRSSYADLQAAPAASSGIFLGGIICILTGVLAPVGIILMIIGLKQMCDTINFFAQRQSLGTVRTTGTLPQLR